MENAISKLVQIRHLLNPNDINYNAIIKNLDAAIEQLLLVKQHLIVHNTESLKLLEPPSITAKKRKVEIDQIIEDAVQKKQVQSISDMAKMLSVDEAYVKTKVKNIRFRAKAPPHP